MGAAAREFLPPAHQPAMSNSATSHALLAALTAPDPIAALSSYAEESVTPAHPPSVAPSAALLAALDFPVQDTVLSVREALYRALSTQLASLPPEGVANFLAALAARLPVGGSDSRGAAQAAGDPPPKPGAAALLFSEGLQRLVALGGGAAPLGAALRARPEALANVPPDVVMALPPPCRQLLWAAAPARCAADASRAVQLLFHSVKGDPAAYAAACTLLQRRFEETGDPKWCALRCDLAVLLHPGGGDPLAPLVLAVERLLNGGPGPEAVVREARGALAGAAAAAAARGPAGPALREALFPAQWGTPCAPQRA